MDRWSKEDTAILQSVPDTKSAILDALSTENSDKRYRGKKSSQPRSPKNDSNNKHRGSKITVVPLELWKKKYGKHCVSGRFFLSYRRVFWVGSKRRIDCYNFAFRARRIFFRISNISWYWYDFDFSFLGSIEESFEYFDSINLNLIFRRFAYKIDRESRTIFSSEYVKLSIELFELINSTLYYSIWHNSVNVLKSLHYLNLYFIENFTKIILQIRPKRIQDSNRNHNRFQ